MIFKDLLSSLLQHDNYCSEAELVAVLRYLEGPGALKEYSRQVAGILISRAIVRLMPLIYWYPKRIRKKAIMMRFSLGRVKRSLVNRYKYREALKRLERARAKSVHRDRGLEIRSSSSTSSDIEEFVRFHRLGWIGQASGEENTTEAIVQYLMEYGCLVQGWGSEPYTVSERIVNITEWLRGREQKVGKALDVIRRAVVIMTEWLMENVEYTLPRYNGNHPLNNGRALYIAGAYSQDEGLRSLGRLIIVERLKEMVTEDGFLNDFSTSYQLLYTRWLVSIYKCAVLHDDEQMIRISRVRLEKAFISFKLLSGYPGLRFKIPLIGDISPDIRMSEMHNELTATELFRKAETRKVEETSVLGHIYRLQYGKWTVFICGDKAERNVSRHSHSDTHSVVVYYEERPIIVDAGRSSYTKEDRYQSAAEAHNGLTVDGCGITPDTRNELIPVQYGSGYSRCKIKRFRHGLCLCMTSHGFSRLGYGPIKHKRVVFLEGKRMSIVDHAIGGLGSIVGISLRFKGVHSGDKSPKGANWSIGGLVCRLKQKGMMEGSMVFERTAGTYSEEYGEKSECEQLILKGGSTGNVKIVTTLENS